MISSVQHPIMLTIDIVTRFQSVSIFRTISLRYMERTIDLSDRSFPASSLSGAGALSKRVVFSARSLRQASQEAQTAAAMAAAPVSRAGITRNCFGNAPIRLASVISSRIRFSSRK